MARNSPSTISRRISHSCGEHDRDIKAVYALVADDFAAVNALIPRRLTSDVGLVEEIGRHIIESGGKRLRPLLVLLSARSLGYNGADHVKLAAIIEFLHTATLLHDDVVDRSDLRRGRATANHLWGNAPSVLVGDFLYSRAFQLMVELGRIDIISILSDATNVIAEGEVQQLANIGNAEDQRSRLLRRHPRQNRDALSGRLAHRGACWPVTTRPRSRRFATTASRWVSHISSSTTGSTTQAIRR